MCHENGGTIECDPEEEDSGIVLTNGKALTCRSNNSRSQTPDITVSFSHHFILRLILSLSLNLEYLITQLMMSSRVNPYRMSSSSQAHPLEEAMICLCLHLQVTNRLQLCDIAAVGLLSRMLIMIKLFLEGSMSFWVLSNDFLIFRPT